MELQAAQTSHAFTENIDVDVQLPMATVEQQVYKNPLGLSTGEINVESSTAQAPSQSIGQRVAWPQRA